MLVTHNGQRVNSLSHVGTILISSFFFFCFVHKHFVFLFAEYKVATGLILQGQCAHLNQRCKC